MGDKAFVAQLWHSMMVINAFFSCRPFLKGLLSLPNGDEDDVLVQARVVLEQVGEGCRDAGVGVGVDDGRARHARQPLSILQQHWRRSPV